MSTENRYFINFTCRKNFTDFIRRNSRLIYNIRRVKAFIIPFTMQVYAEYALVENFCMDFALLFCAKAVTKNTCGYFRLSVAAALGACFAVVYPLFGLNAVWGVVVKIVSGGLLCALAGRYTKALGYIKFTAVFTASTFLLGGALIALFSLTGANYESGGGYLLSSVPVGIPLFFAVALVITVKTIAKKIIANRRQGEYACTVKIGEKQAACTGFYDSGNKVYSGGKPVSIIPKEVAEKLVEVSGIKTFVDIHTVAGKGKIAVFSADCVTLRNGESERELRGVLFGVSPQRIKKIILHSDLSEVN